MCTQIKEFPPIWEVFEHCFCTFSLLLLVSAFFRTPHAYILLPRASHGLSKLCHFLTIFSLLSRSNHLHRPVFTVTLFFFFCYLSSERTLFCGSLHSSHHTCGELSLMSFFFPSVRVTHSCFFVCLLTLDFKINAVIVTVCLFSKKSRSNRVLTCTSGWPGKPYIEQAGSKLLKLFLLQPGEH